MSSLGCLKRTQSSADNENSRSYLGVCPQVNAIDPALTGMSSFSCNLAVQSIIYLGDNIARVHKADPNPVRQHLWLYARLKGVPKSSIPKDIDSLLTASGLLPKADQLATSLSGGNQRKLSLAMALIGGRPVVLIDEFSSGVDPFSKREAWATVRRFIPLPDRGDRTVWSASAVSVRVSKLLLMPDAAGKLDEGQGGGHDDA